MGVIAISLAESDLASPSDASATGVTLLSGSSKKTCSSMVSAMSQVSMTSEGSPARTRGVAFVVCVGIGPSSVVK